MKRYWFIISFLFIFIHLGAQENDSTINPRYLEDQIYLSLTYNILLQKPVTIVQNGFSGGVSIGFIKDIPFNSQRNFGIGIGIGYAYNVFIQNLKITEVNSVTFFEIAQDYNTNRFGISTVELPFEIRWRNSTLNRYKFWRIYGGFKVSYVLMAKSTFKDSLETFIIRNSSKFNKFQYGLTLATGFGTWNLYVYYGLNPIFKNGDLNGTNLNLKDFNVGVKFYIM
ncbi:MAG: porin family protein [Lutibacter sp.]|uniref:porin family protein n=1 Tax=Lutibacter sp. TaxID=1925666 RepID=UPI003858B77A